MTDEYARALMRHSKRVRSAEGMEAAQKINEMALRACSSALHHLAGISHPGVDNLRISKAVLLFMSGRDEESKKEFLDIASTAIEEKTRRMAGWMAMGPSLTELAKKGPETFFEGGGFFS